MTAAEALHALSPENDLEAALVNTPVFLRGLAWGQPRPGHPEGAVLYQAELHSDPVAAGYIPAAVPPQPIRPGAYVVRIAAAPLGSAGRLCWPALPPVSATRHRYPSTEKLLSLLISRLRE